MTPSDAYVLYGCPQRQLHTRLILLFLLLLLLLEISKSPKLKPTPPIWRFRRRRNERSIFFQLRDHCRKDRRGTAEQCRIGGGEEQKELRKYQEAVFASSFQRSRTDRNINIKYKHYTVSSCSQTGQTVDRRHCLSVLPRVKLLVKGFVKCCPQEDGSPDV